jgi:benzoyl-CoA reductase/2-hydroxyglutaryl-CoA dehydratase subunit BcrC/BadD/HgdB
LVVVPCTDKNIAAIADCWEMWTETKLFRLGVPHNNIPDYSFEYYLEGLNLLKAEIEKLTGNPITGDELKEEIAISNKIRLLLKQISEMRKSERPPISGLDFIKLHHASFCTDRRYTVKVLESLVQELEEKEGTKGPRILLIGSTIAEGDYKLYDLLESTGANVVIEDFSEGLRPYWQEVESDGNLIEALADTYFRKRTPTPAFFRPAEKRILFLLKLAKEFRVDGIIWYSTLYREAYDIEGVYFRQIAENEGLHFMKVVSDYDNSERGVLQTRIEAFVESIKQGLRR